VIQQHFAKISAFVVTAALLALLLSYVELSDLTATLRKIGPVYLLLGLVAYTSCYLFRALRFRVLLNKEVSVVDLFSIVCVHNMVNDIMPARSGELSYIYLLKKLHHKNASDGAATLILSRLLDLISISILFFASVILAGELPGEISGLLSAIALSAALVVLLFMALIYGGRAFVVSVERLAARLDLNRLRLIRLSIDGMKEAECRIAAVRNREVFLFSFLLSLLVWTSQYLMYYVLMRGLGMELSFALIVLGTTFAIFTSIMPVPSIGSFGVYEGLWTISFVALGFPKETAIATGFAIHIIFIVYFVFLGSIGIAKIGLASRTSRV
jgi:hypothetical protein